MLDAFVGNTYAGTLAYADDLVLIAASASAMRKMLSIWDNYALEFHNVFQCPEVEMYRNTSEF